MKALPRIASLLLLALPSIALAAAEPARPLRFAVAGDSRNCGDIVMPAIAASVKRDGAAFYWHIGDLRSNYNFDEDLVAEAKQNGKSVDVLTYQRTAWPDAVRNQLMPFAPLPFYLAIGNHELVPPHTRLEFIAQFADWLNQPSISAQRLADDPTDHAVRLWFHWIVQGTDFISLDSATDDMFDSAQLAWFEKRLAEDAGNPAIHTVVVGSHSPLPHSIACYHSMSDSPQMNATGTRAYRDLLRFRTSSGKPVYLFASHSHFVIGNVFDSDYWRANGGVIPGWIIGTAGATRYRLPDTGGRGSFAKTDVYGYLLGTVNPNGTVDVVFREIKRANVPADVLERYPAATVDQCFDGNRSMAPAKQVTCNEAVNCGGE